MMLNKSQFPLVLMMLVIVLLLSCTTYNKLTFACAVGGNLEKGAKVLAGEKHIGNVESIKPNKELDTFYVTIKTNRGVKIPLGSTFMIEEYLLGPSIINVNYSD